MNENVVAEQQEQLIHIPHPAGRPDSTMCVLQLYCKGIVLYLYYIVIVVQGSRATLYYTVLRDMPSRVLRLELYRTPCLQRPGMQPGDGQTQRLLGSFMLLRFKREKRRSWRQKSQGIEV
jgi:hypothetical protein